MGNNLLQASFTGDAAKVETLLAVQDLQSFLNYQNKDGFTALHAATANNDLDVTRLLIEAGCNVNVTSAVPHDCCTKWVYTHHEGTHCSRCNVDLPQHDGAMPLYLTAFFWESGGH